MASRTSASAGGALLAVLAAGGGASTADAAVPAAPGTVDLQGQVVDGKGGPVAQLVVYAVERGSQQIAAATRSDSDGLFQLTLPSRVHDFGVMSGRWLMGGLERNGTKAIKLVVYPAFPDTDVNQ